MSKRKQNVSVRQQGYVLVTVLVAAFLVAAIAFLVNHESTISTNMAAGDFERDELRYVTEAGLNHARWQLSQNQTCASYSGLSSTSFGDHTYSALLSPADGSPISISVTGVLANGITDNLAHNDVKVYDSAMPMTGILTIVAGGMDTFIEGASGHTHHNKGGDSELKISSEIGNEYRTLLQFDLSALPPSATVQAAILELDLKNHGSTDVVEAHRVLRNWTENGVTWNDHDGTSSWSTPGSDFDPNIAGSLLADSTGLKTMDITDLAKGWASGTQPNYGLLLLSPPSAGGSENKFYSSDQGGSPQPRLVVTYICECGTPCPGIVVGQNVILSTEGNATLGGLSFTDKDLAEFDRIADTATLFFDGALLGLDQDIDAVYVLANGHIVLSAINTINLGGITAENEDLIILDPVADSATMLFDGSALFTSGSTDISAVHVQDNGHLLLTNEYSATLGGVNFGPTDIINYDPESNVATMFLDGSTVGLTAWIDAVHLLDNGHIVLSTDGSATLGGLSFAEGDLVEYDPVADSATLFLDGELFSGSENVRSVHIGPGSGSINGNILLVVGNSASPSGMDSDRKLVMESWGYAVTLIDDNESQVDLEIAAAANDVIYVSDSISDGDLGDKLTLTRLGIVSESGGKLDDFGFTGNPMSTVSYDQYTATDGTHYITEPLGGGAAVLFTEYLTMPLFSGLPAPGLHSVGSIGSLPWALPTL
ncbi:MAG: DNRLRE domain-containing protein, partial [Woeseiaceae bacterium]